MIELHRRCLRNEIWRNTIDRLCRDASDHAMTRKDMVWVVEELSAQAAGLLEKLHDETEDKPMSMLLDESFYRMVNVSRSENRSMKRIVDTDNFCRDYPNERFVLGPLPEEDAEAILIILNRRVGPHDQRCYKVVDEDYVLEPGFEP